ncbi:MAG: hypothetical protein ABIH59_02430 [archaeon]
MDGEMCKKINKKGGSSVKISNAESIIIKHIIDNFKIFFNISPKSWTASLSINNKGLTNYNDNILKKYWSRKIGISLDKFTKTTFQNKYRSKFSKNGIIQIRYSNTLFFKLFLELLRDLREIILKDKKFCEFYLRGLASGEGGIGKRGTKLRIVHIGGIKDEDKEFYSKCVSNLGLLVFKNTN